MTMTSNDLDMLKAVVDQTAAKAEPGGRFDEAEGAVANVLRLLNETTQGNEMWQSVYDAVKSAYVGYPDWEA